MNRIIDFIDSLGKIPAAPLAGFPGIPLTGKTMKDNLSDSDIQLNSLLKLYDELHQDIVFHMMDLTAEAESLGCAIKFPDDQPPSVFEHIIKTEDDMRRVFGNKNNLGRKKIFSDVVKGLKKHLSIPVGCYVIGPFTLSGELMGQSDALKAIRKNPGFLHEILNKSSESISNYAAMLIDSGADILCILEPSAVMLPPAVFYEFSGQYCRRIYEENSKAMSVLHVCGNTTALLEEFKKVGAEGLSLDSDVDFSEALSITGKDTVLIGNLNPVSLLAQGTPEKIRKETCELLSKMSGAKNFILSSGCDIPETAPLENLKAMMDCEALNAEV